MLRRDNLSFTLQQPPKHRARVGARMGSHTSQFIRCFRRGADNLFFFFPFFFYLSLFLVALSELRALRFFLIVSGRLAPGTASLVKDKNVY
jgi:hypothetical protein